jgi:hypothetical protein
MSMFSTASSKETPAFAIVDHDQVDRLDPLGGEGFQVVGHVAPSEDAAVKLRVQGLDPAAEDLGLTGVGGDFRDLEPSVGEGGARAPAGQEVNAARGQGARQLDQAALVGHAQQGPPHRNNSVHSALALTLTGRDRDANPWVASRGQRNPPGAAAGRGASAGIRFRCRSRVPGFIPPGETERRAILTGGKIS